MNDKETILNLLQNPNISAPLLAAAGSGLVGGAVSSSSGRRRGESRAERRRRTIRDALLSAGAGGLATAGIRHGFNELSTALPEGQKNPAGGVLGGLLAGGLGIGAGTKAHLKAENSRGTVARSIVDRVYPAMTNGKDYKGTNAQALTLMRANRKNPIFTQSDFDKLNISSKSGLGAQLAEEWDRLAGGTRATKARLAGKGLKGQAGGWAASAGRSGLRAAKRHPGIAAGTATALAAKPTWDYIVRPTLSALSPNLLTYD